MVVTAFAPGVFGRMDGSARRAGAVTERNVTALRSMYWLLVLSGFFEPLFYLLSIGVGVGRLIGSVHLANGATVAYATFVAPAMLASSAMTGALSESTFNFFSKMTGSKIFDGVLATPVRPMEIAVGELMWAMARGAIYSGAFCVIMVLMGDTTAGPAALAFVAALLVGFAFGSVGMAASTFMRSWQDFDLVGTVQVALFLFSATFAPLSVYPAGVRRLIEVTPLYQAVALIRSITLDQMSTGLLAHVAYLIVMIVIGLAVASRRMAIRLLK